MIRNWFFEVNQYFLFFSDFQDAFEYFEEILKSELGGFSASKEKDAEKKAE